MTADDLIRVAESRGLVVTVGPSVRLPGIEQRAEGLDLDIDEKAFQAKVVKLAKEWDWECYHTFDSRRSESGFPDLVLAHDARRLLLFRELKTETGTVTAAQKRWLNILRRAGADADVWRPSHWSAIVATLTGATC